MFKHEQLEYTFYCLRLFFFVTVYMCVCECKKNIATGSVKSVESSYRKVSVISYNGRQFKKGIQWDLERKPN